MERRTPGNLRCAIYTRKSTDAGLDRELNTLQAQRETCSAYIRSQQHRGWVELPQHYDDGGYSGGSMDRPALAQMLADIEASRIDIVVIYKIDRLTRSLMDFVRLIDTMQSYEVSFVSVTQQFDTSDALGRLIQNILLTFAQFEREMVGDRLRDKFAVMKRKGKWIGGREPFGYRKENGRLIIDEECAAIVRDIYERYPTFPSANQLLRALQAEGVRNRVRISSAGRAEGGRLFSQGLLHHILRSPIYTGHILHDGDLYPGEHEAIIPLDQWERVQALRRQRHENQIPRKPTGSLLLGILFDQHGRRMDVDAVTFNGKPFRYYATRQARTPLHERLKIVRADADEVERLAAAMLRTFLADRPAINDALTALGHFGPDIEAAAENAAAMSARLSRMGIASLKPIFHALFKRAEISRDRFRILISCQELYRFLCWDGIGLFKPEARAKPDTRIHVLDIGVCLVRENQATYLPIAPRDANDVPMPNPGLVRLIEEARAARAAVYADRHLAIADIARSKRMSPTRYARLVKLNYLAPDIIAAIIDGGHPPDLTARKLLRTSVPLDWAVQRQMLGFAPRHDIGGSLIRNQDWRQWDAAYGYDSSQLITDGDKRRKY